MGRKGQEIEGKQSAERDVESNDDMWRVQAHSKLGIARSVHLAGFTSPRDVKEGNNTDTELICVFTGEAVRTLGFSSSSSWMPSSRWTRHTRQLCPSPTPAVLPTSWQVQHKHHLLEKKNVKATKFPREPERKRDVKGIKNSFSDN